jgi:uncharacterized protein (TIGR03437 family)
LDKLKITLFSALVIATLGAPAADAQATAANITIISGNGQMISPGSARKLFTFFYPMVVKVTDANGNPIPNKSINWGLISSIGTLPSFSPFTTTDVNGISICPLAESGGLTGTFQTPFLQSVIQATADSASATFTETVELNDQFANQLAFAQFTSSASGNGNGVLVSGPAGSVGATPLTVHIDAFGIGIPNVSVRLVNTNPATLPSVTCATQSGAQQLGADPGSVLTDINGNASCYPLFGPIPGKNISTANLLVGGIDPIEFDQTISFQPLATPLAFQEFDGIQIAVTQVLPGRLSISSGSGQTVAPGGTATLLALVQDSTGTVPVANATVVWSVIPVGSATLSAGSSLSNTQGVASINVTLAPGATGQIQVRASLTGANSSLTQTFTVNTLVTLSSLTKVSGDGQSISIGQNFAAPLIVQASGTNGQPLSNVLVAFSVSGPATISATTASTDSTGRAQVTVFAGATAGSVTVSALAGGITQTFTLTVIPAGPSLSPSSFFSTAGLFRLSALSPCSLVTVLGSGIAPNIQNLQIPFNAFGPFPTILGGASVTIGGVAAPILNVGTVGGNQQITFQVPCEAAPSNGTTVTVNVGGGTGSTSIPIVAATPGIFQTPLTDGTFSAVLVRPDGTFVSLQNPARRGETVRVYVTGLGAAAPSVSTGALPVPGSDSLLLGQIIVGVNNSGARIITARVSPNLIGVSEIAFQVPADAPAGNAVVLSVAVNVNGDSQTRFSQGSSFPVQ